MIPKGATHVWTPAVDTPYVQWYLFRRAFYKRMHGIWWSYTVDEQWVQSRNDIEWFNTEREQGYFVTIDTFNDPEFIPKKEAV